jgi:undecaprenyl-diphosphatase
MDILSIIILGIVQGITEWIPISSKTQVTFVYLNFLKGDMESVVPILLYVHVGTVIAATIYFRKEIMAMLHKVMEKPTDFKTHLNGKIGFLLSSLLFTGVLGLPLLFLEKGKLNGILEQLGIPQSLLSMISSPTLDVGWLYSVMGVLMIITGFLLLTQKKGSGSRKIKDATWKDGILTGLLQGISILPGVSRAGTSTTGLIWQGFDSESSFHLSFLLSIPTVVIAEILLNYLGGLSSFPVSDGILLALTSFVVGYLTLDAVLRIVKKVNMAYVAFALGIIIIAVGLLHQG